jgi:hypothetical protein
LLNGYGSRYNINDIIASIGRQSAGELMKTTKLPKNIGKYIKSLSHLEFIVLTV